MYIYVYFIVHIGGTGWVTEPADDMPNTPITKVLVST